MPKIKTSDWRNLPTERWNCTSFTAFLVDLTAERYGVEYEPTGGGSKVQRWSREKGMLKNAQEKYGNAVLRRFIEMCVEQYTPKPEYPYDSFTFAYSYMSDRFPKAQAEIAAEARRAQAEADVEATSYDELRGWL